MDARKRADLRNRCLRAAEDFPRGGGGFDQADCHVGWYGAAAPHRQLQNFRELICWIEFATAILPAPPFATRRLSAMFSQTYLSACLCFKNAADYLTEWLAFHSAIGVEHFYLYNNESTDRFADALEPFLATGVVTLIDYPGKGVQQEIYTHCLRNFGDSTRWLMFCDDDEFLFPVKDISLPDALAPYEAYAGVAAAWMLYGSSGHWIQPRGLVIENYAMRSAVPDHHVKCIVDPRRIVQPFVIGHHFECVAGHVIVDENGDPMNGPLNPRPSANVFRINHYLTKSRTEMVERRRQIQANTGKVSPLSLAEWTKLETTWNEVRDPIAARYGDRVRDSAQRISRETSALADSDPRLR